MAATGQSITPNRRERVQVPTAEVSLSPMADLTPPRDKNYDWKRYFNNEREDFRNITKQALMLENHQVINQILNRREKNKTISNIGNIFNVVKT